ncbi:Holliday junction resolvase RuvX, partial [Vibrio sp. 2094]
MSRTIMAFDFGTKSIGSAIGQEITGTASPLKAFKANDGIPNWDDIEKQIKEWQPDLLVVGLPTDLH